MKQFVPDVDPRTGTRRFAWVVGIAALCAAFGVDAMGIGHQGLANVRFVLFLALGLIGCATCAYAVLLTRDISLRPYDSAR